VQCKHCDNRRVGVEKVREIVGVMTAKKVPRRVFATTPIFSCAAKTFFHRYRIGLFDMDKLLEKIVNKSPEQQSLLQVDLEGACWRPKCLR
jgi:restriction system protein